jgi:alpha-tubulin suppressor-like RCC1 family protein
MVPAPANYGGLDTGVPPTVRIDQLTSAGSILRTLATFTANSGPEHEHIRIHYQGQPCDPDDTDGDTDPNGYYYARWFTNDAHLTPSSNYRVRVLVPDKNRSVRELGYADVAVVTTTQQFMTIDTSNFTPLLNGTTLRIKFRIDEPAVDQDQDGVHDWDDDCPKTSDPDQEDDRHNHVGNACRCEGVTCTPLDSCHTTGVCQPKIGSCTNPIAPNGTACPIPNASGTCAAGVCGLQTCHAGYADCNNSLADGCETAITTVNNCGACGVACTSGPNAVPVCNSGSCALSCATGYADCDGKPSTGCEQNIATDAVNCGACGNVCANHETCVAGVCTTAVCQAGYADCDMNPANGCEVTLASDATNCGHCGLACSFANASAACVSASCVVAACNSGYADCNLNPSDGCEANLQGDVQNCGACGLACAAPNAGPACTAGACGIASCFTGFADCNMNQSDGCERNLTNDVNNCGSCGAVCVVPNATAACSASNCTIASCNPGYMDCNGSAGDGCEVNVGADVLNCGGCGIACPSGPNSQPTCGSSGCGLICATGYADCDGNPANGCEVNLQSDAANCGTCKTVCTNNETCQLGACSTAVCAAGFGDCNGLASDGCEATLATDPSNCGACHNACSFPNAVPDCVTGVCSFSICSTGYADCDGVVANGCEVDLATDVNNCGGCGASCPVPSGVASAACSNATCGIGSCIPGRADCNGIASDGCEVDTTHDVNNCGGCNIACPSGWMCSSGSCQSPAASAIAAGFYHTCAILSGGSVACWGDNAEGELGNGMTTSSLTPVMVVNVDGTAALTGATAIAASFKHTCALMPAGSVACWGDNLFGELGNGTKTNASTPVMVSGVSGATSIAAGYDHTCVLLAGGSVECWGYNHYGELGDGTTTNSTTPVTVPGLTGVIALAAGQFHTCALLSGGSVACWGYNVYGQLGNGATTNSSTPVMVSGLSAATALTAGMDHACALVSGGSVACWGYDGDGQLGDGTNNTSSTPVAVVGLSGAISVQAGDVHTCALLSTGNVACWGYNIDGELGNGTTTLSSTPVTVSNLSQAIGIEAGDAHSCALLSGGAVACWGFNFYGELGNGLTTNSTTPVLVPTL